jgi:hypothetical protein
MGEGGQTVGAFVALGRGDPIMLGPFRFSFSILFLGLVAFEAVSTPAQQSPAPKPPDDAGSKPPAAEFGLPGEDIPGRSRNRSGSSRFAFSRSGGLWKSVGSLARPSRPWKRRSPPIRRR